MKKLEEAWNDFNRELGKNSFANRIDQSNSKNEGVKMDDDWFSIKFFWFLFSFKHVLSNHID